ncbi:MAG: hypothetical protein LBB12_04410, partial [Holosporaceae bacterium]|nr:hypothetical protein [Holosporaceae bacterium]
LFSYLFLHFKQIISDYITPYLKKQYFITGIFISLLFFLLAFKAHGMAYLFYHDVTIVKTPGDLKRNE